MTEFRMPSLGADMEAGTLVEWLVKPGDRVKRGDIIAVVETQKGAIEIETFQAGQIDKFLVDLHSKVPVGTPLALIRTEGEAEAAAAAPLPPPVELACAHRRPRRHLCRRNPRRHSRCRRRLLPASRPGLRHLRLRGASLRNTASISRQSPAAVRVGQSFTPTSSAISARPPPPIEKKRVAWLDLAAMRTAIAAAMARSKREIPHYYLEHQVDVTPCERWLAQRNAALPPDSRLLIGALALKAVALAIHRFPAFNGFYRDNKFEPSTAVHVGVAIAIRGGGLAAPALHDADQLPLDQLMSGLRDLVQRTRAGRIRSSEMSDPTITVSSLGERGVETLYGIIYPPQVAIVGFGKVVTRPWVVDDAIGPRSVVTMTLGGDHRVTDGHMGALFLAEIGKLLQEPEKL